MIQPPPLPGEHPQTHHKDGQHAPFLAMWYQIRDALADLLIPVFAGLKVVWLIAFTPVHFFKSDLDETADLAKTHTPFDIAWRALSSEDRTPLDAAKFLFFGILTAALAGFGFDNTNRLSGLLAQSGALDSATRQIPGLSLVALRLRLFLANENVQAVQALLDVNLVAAIIEFVVTLFITMIFAYLFGLAAGRQISAAKSYTFWLYLTGMQFFTTAITFVFFKIFSLPAINLPQFTPELFFLVVEYGWTLLWLYALPLYILPKIFPVTVRRTLLALLLTHGLFILTGWLFRAGFTTILLFWSSLASRF